MDRNFSTRRFTSDTVFTTYSLRSNVPYAFRISATNRSGAGQASDKVTFYAGDNAS